MKRFPKVNPNTYRVNPTLDGEKFEFTPETQEFREKIEKFIKKEGMDSNHHPLLH